MIKSYEQINNIFTAYYDHFVAERQKCPNYMTQFNGNGTESEIFFAAEHKLYLEMIQGFEADIAQYTMEESGQKWDWENYIDQKELAYSAELNATILANREAEKDIINVN